jgi:predicted aspartyl protease
LFFVYCKYTFDKIPAMKQKWNRFYLIVLPVLITGCVNKNYKNMETGIAEFFTTKGYTAITLGKLITEHITVTAKINNREGLFILDSGAGSTVVDEKHREYFHLTTYVDSIKGAGAGGSELTVHAADNNELSVSTVTLPGIKLSAMNLEHVTAGLKQYGVTENIHGVIGADFLKKTNAVIDYKTMQLYIKQ